MAIMCWLTAAFPVTMRSSRGSASASQSSIAVLTSRPSRCPRCVRVTAVSCWCPHSGLSGSASTAVTAAISPLASCSAASVYMRRPCRSRTSSICSRTRSASHTECSSPTSCGASPIAFSTSAYLARYSVRGAAVPARPASTRPPPAPPARAGTRPGRPGSCQHEHPPGLDQPGGRADPGGERRAGRALERPAAEHRPPARRRPPGGVPQQRGSDPAAPRRRTHGQVQVGPVAVLALGQDEVVPAGHRAGRLVGADPRLGRVGRVLEPAPQPLQRPRRPERVVGFPRRPHGLEARLSRRPVRCVPSYDAHAV